MPVYTNNLERTFGPYTCARCGMVRDSRVFVARDLYFPNCVSGAMVLNSDDSDLESFCGIVCLVKQYSDLIGSTKDSGNGENA